MDEDMIVTKRNGNEEIVSFDKILKRIKKIGQEVNIKINYTSLAMKVIDQLYSGISTTKIDELSAEQCASMSSIHPDYNILAGRITISNHHKNSSSSFSNVMQSLYDYRDKHDAHSPIVTSQLIDFVNQNKEELDQLCDYERDYLIEYFGFKTLERAYLMKINNVVVERPQHMWLRVSIGIHQNNMEKIKETYNLMSQKFFTHATPTLFNAGTPKPQLSSCYLLAMETDSIAGIYNTLKDCALISKWAGGIGLHIHNIRASGSHIRGTNGSSNGIVPMLKVFNNTAKYVDQGGGKRNGSFAIYLEPWHFDIEMFLQMRKNHGDEELKARDLFYALWIPDLFMERIKNDGDWTLMCPDECPGLADVHNNDFKILYEKYESQDKGRKTMKARELWFQILDAQMETGTPYLCYKDIANRKSNQQNIGTIKSSNLCVTPDTLILTDNGPIEIEKLKDLDVNVWNGHEFSKVNVHQTGVNQPILTVETSDGSIIRCTHYHKFFIYSQDNSYVIIKQAKELEEGDIIMNCDYPVIPGIHSLVSSPSDYEINTEDKYILFYYENIGFTQKQKCVLQGFGVNIPICKIKQRSVLKLSYHDMSILIKNGLDLSLILHTEIANNIMYELSKPFDIPSKTNVTIKSIVDFERRENTFCFHEHKRNAGIFNGILTSQCSEIIEYSDENESAVCNLASIALPAFINDTDKDNIYFDYDKLHQVTKVITYNLNKIIDVNFYPTEKTQRSNLRHRPIGIGVQGLADVFMRFNLPFASEQSKILNKNIFETIYHASVEKSWELSITDGPYETFQGSPASNGILQFDLWNQTVDNSRYNWDELKNNIQKDGLRNSLLLAPMPTASTSQILGYNECIEPITSNIYNRRTIAGEFILANKYLMKDLIDLNLWNEKIKNNIIANNGSIQQLDIIPENIRDKYKTVWEIPMKELINMAADRGVFICQSQSLNLWLEDPNYSNLTSMHFYAWSKGLKTGIYYLRRRARHQAQQFTIEPEKTDVNPLVENVQEEICEMCSA